MPGTTPVMSVRAHDLNHRRAPSLVRRPATIGGNRTSCVTRVLFPAYRDGNGAWPGYERAADMSSGWVLAGTICQLMLAAFAGGDLANGVALGKRQLGILNLVLLPTPKGWSSGKSFSTANAGHPVTLGRDAG